MKATVLKLKQELVEAKKRQDEASKDVKRIEKDMKDFDSNKDGKLKELQITLDALRETLASSSASVKVQQKEVQGSRLDLEQVGADLSTAQEHLQECQQTLTTQGDELQALTKEEASVKVSAELTERRL
jgi:structural maintenance of chromosome 2